LSGVNGQPLLANATESERCSLEVERNSSKSPLVDVQPLEDEVRVENDPGREDEATDRGHGEIEGRREREEDRKERYHEEDNDSSHQVGVPREDIVFGL